jgi:hypothetical protein
MFFEKNVNKSFIEAFCFVALFYKKNTKKITSLWGLRGEASLNLSSGNISSLKGIPLTLRM